MKWYGYPTKAIWDAAGPAIVAIIAPLLPALAVVSIQFIARVPVYFDVGRLGVGLVCLLVLGWILLMVACVPRAYAYCQKFTLCEEGIAKKLFGREIVIQWASVDAVEKRIAPTFKNYRWIDETFLIIKGKDKIFTVYDQLEDFEEFKDTLSSTCRRLSIPQVIVDRSAMTFSRIKRDDFALYRKSRRTGVRTSVERI